MGGVDKGLVSVRGRELVRYVVEALQPQVRDLIVNANRNQEIYARLGFRVVADAPPGFHGPLAGMASAMRVASTPFIATVPCDSPFVPADLVGRLYRARVAANATIAVAHDGERLQPVFALIDCRRLDSLVAFLARGERKIDRWYDGERTTTADFSDSPRTFLNLNTPEDVASTEALLMP
ncbi:MAG: molybdenum cofactor guanylyltransferase [Gammaproteobacteria bacterium]|nr:molybdenum cofactor guanylyltransferase [Gammaproteobacteria bacterium]